MRDPGEQISQSTIDWVEGFVPDQIGEGKYIAHITVGFATLDDLKLIEAEPFAPFASPRQHRRLPPRQQRGRAAAAQGVVPRLDFMSRPHQAPNTQRAWLIERRREELLGWSGACTEPQLIVEILRTLVA